MDKNAPIGIFDSGVGGLTNTRSIVDLLPNESVIYIGDTEHSPYGPKPIAQVRHYAQEIADNLVERGCKMIVIACNTASSAFLRDARERYDIPVIGVIAPAVRRAAAVTHNGKVGVIGTVGTVNSGAYQELFDVIPGVHCYAQACPRFVDFVERGITNGRQILGLAESYLAPLQEKGVDTLVMGCTHYPLLSGVLQLVMGDKVTLVSSAEETAKDVYRILSDMDMLADQDASEAKHIFESTGDPEIFRQLASRFLGPAIELHA